MQTVHVHFLYGSRPGKGSAKSERKWFGGVLGGHVGIEIPGRGILHFYHKGAFRIVPKRKNHHAAFSVSDAAAFYGFHGGDPDLMKKLVIEIPVDHSQLDVLEKRFEEYVSHNPYDYALFGMRCAAAVHELLVQMRILPAAGRVRTLLQSFYPRLLRRRLLREAAANRWKISRTDGTDSRKWDRD